MKYIDNAQTEPKVQPYRMTKDLHRKALILIVGGSERCVHALCTSYETVAGQASQEGDNAEERVKRLKKLGVDTQIKDKETLLNQTTRHWHTQAASCESASGEVSAARSAWTAAVTSGV